MDRAKDFVSNLPVVNDSKHVAIKCDVSNPERVQVALDQTRNLLGRPLGALVNAAGISKDALLVSQSYEDIHTTVAINLLGALYLTKHAVRIMLRDQEEGSIVHIGSVAADKGGPGQVAYSASKAGLAGLVKSAAREYGRKGIRINLLVAGFTETPMTATLSSERIQQIRDATALGRFAKPSDIAAGVLFLTSPAARHITGAALNVDGGFAP